MRHIRALAGAASVALLIGGAVTTHGGSALAEAPAAAVLPDDVPDVTPDELPDVTRYPLASTVGDTVAAWQRTPAGAAQVRTSLVAGPTPQVGTKRMWPALD